LSVCLCARGLSERTCYANAEKEGKDVKDKERERGGKIAIRR